MKKLLLAAYIFFCTGGTYAQERQNTVVAELDFNRSTVLQFVKPDTLRATLLITRNRMRMAYSYEGYMVIHQKDTIYLDDRKRVIKLPVKVWGVKIKDKLNPHP